MLIFDRLFLVVDNLFPPAVLIHFHTHSDPRFLSLITYHASRRPFLSLSAPLLFSPLATPMIVNDLCIFFCCKTPLQYQLSPHFYALSI